MSKCWLLVVLALVLSGCDQGGTGDAKKQDPKGAQSKAGDATTQPAAAVTNGAAAGADQIAAGKALFAQKCQLCHMPLDSDGKRLGPSIETTLNTLPKELTEAAYQQRVTALKTLNRKYYDAKEPAITKVVAEKSADGRLKEWLRQYLEDPKFDDPKNTMARVAGLSPADVEATIAYILSHR
ncbi:MAG: c-type cytochrome [Planctomycetota bacterium]